MPDNTPTGDNASVTTADAQDGSIADTVQSFTEALSDTLAEVTDGETVGHVEQAGQQLAEDVGQLVDENEQLESELQAVRDRLSETREELAETTDMEIPKEYRVVCADCGADGGTYSFTVSNGEPSYCPWCGHAVDGDVTSVVSAERETTALSHGGDR
jgi:regulator of replication initiation timing